MTNHSGEPGKNLPREYFTAPDLFDRETQRIFTTNWICVGHLAEFPVAPSYRVVEIGRYSIVITRGRDGAWHAFHNVCRHRGARICVESSDRMPHERLVCPYHAWCYDSRGGLTQAPNMADDERFDRRDYSLRPVAVHNWNGLIMLRLLGGQFAADFGPINDRLARWSPDQLRVGKTMRYSVRANWKLLFQNYSECYHCPTVHPVLNRLTPYRSATNDLTSGPFLGGPMDLAHGIETLSTDGKLISPRIPTLTSAEWSQVFFYTLFPNLFISAHPDYLLVHVLSRQTPCTTDVVCYFLVPETLSDDGSLARATELWDNVNRQDWHVCELAQLGADSPAYQPGPYSKFESMVLEFDRHYLSVLHGEADSEQGGGSDN